MVNNKVKIMKTLEELNMQIAEQADVLKDNESFCIMKISKVAFDEMYTPYRYYGNIFKFCEGDYRYMSDFMLFVDDFETIKDFFSGYGYQVSIKEFNGVFPDEITISWEQ